MGIHWPQGAAINSTLVESYNKLVNWRREARSKHLALRGDLDTTLAEAFWRHTQLGHVVPDFDDAAMEGEVALNFVQQNIPVKSKLRYQVAGTPQYNIPAGSHAGFTDPNGNWVAGANQVFVELKDGGVSVSLANIELAKQTAAFAKLRDQFSDMSDDHIIDLLMEGIRIPDEQLKQPILLDRATTIFGYSERHAMDGANLDLSRTTGKTELALNFRLPPMNSGGIVLITCEIVPEQLFERMYDNFMGTVDPSTLPNFMRDYLDPQKVEIVKNNYADVMHSTPNGTFGYAPLNHAWKRSMSRIGGKFFRPNPDAFSEDRQRFWSVERLNPTLTGDFYLVRSDLPHSVFADTLSDPLEVLTVGNVRIVGNTVFGQGLEENQDSYDEIMEQVDTGRIEPN